MFVRGEASCADLDRRTRVGYVASMRNDTTLRRE